MNYNRGYCNLRAMRERDKDELRPERAGVSAAEAENGAGCAGRSASLAMVYSPKQSFIDILPPCEALKTGTVFRQLVMPFYGERGNKGGCCL